MKINKYTKKSSISKNDPIKTKKKTQKKKLPEKPPK